MNISNKMKQTKDNKNFWQKTAKIYAPFMRSSAPVYKEICDCICEKLNRNMDVLELACGTGQLSIPLSSKVHLWEATDFSEAMITQAKRHQYASQLHFSVQDATNLPYAPESFDAIVISNALHIMPFPEKAMKEIYRVLKPDAFLFAPTFVHGESTRARFQVKLMSLVGFKTYNKWNVQELVDFVETYGFHVTKQQIMGSKIAPLSYIEGCKK